MKFFDIIKYFNSYGNKNFIKKENVKKIQYDKTTKDVITHGKLKVYFGKVLLDNNQMNFRKMKLKSGLVNLSKNGVENNTEGSDVIIGLQDGVIEGHVHVIAQLGMLMAIMNFTSQHKNLALFVDKNNLYSNNISTNKGMSCTRVVVRNNKFEDTEKYEKVDIRVSSKYKVVNSIKQEYNINTEQELRDHWIEYGEVFDYTDISF